MSKWLEWGCSVLWELGVPLSGGGCRRSPAGDFSYAYVTRLEYEYKLTLIVVLITTLALFLACQYPPTDQAYTDKWLGYSCSILLAVGFLTFIFKSVTSDVVKDDVVDMKDVALTYVDIDGNGETSWLELSVANAAALAVLGILAALVLNEFNRLKQKIAHLTDANQQLLPPHWESMLLGESHKIVSLDCGSDEYKRVEGRFRSTCRATDYTIVSIQRLQAKYAWRQYQLMKNMMDQRNDRTPGANERTLWHGAPHATVPQIIQNGYNRSFSSVASFGHGVYFAKNASYSANPRYSVPTSDGTQSMFLTRVLVGRTERGYRGRRQPQVVPGTEDRFDCLVDDVDGPQIFVSCHNDNQAYPEHIVKFKKRLGDDGLHRTGGGRNTKVKFNFKVGGGGAAAVRSLASVRIERDQRFFEALVPKPAWLDVNRLAPPKLGFDCTIHRGTLSDPAADILIEVQVPLEFPMKPPITKILTRLDTEAYRSCVNADGTLKARIVAKLWPPLVRILPPNHGTYKVWLQVLLEELEIWNEIRQ